MEKGFSERIEKAIFEVFLGYIAETGIFQNRPSPITNDSQKNNPTPNKTLLKKSLSGIENLVSESFESKKTKDSDLGVFTVHEFEAERKTENKDEIKIAISYFSGKKDELEIEISGKKSVKYSVETESDNQWNEPYGVIVHYERKHGIDRISISYYEQAGNYMAKHMMDKEDMSQRVPLKWLNVIPESMMGGILGFTYLGDHSMGRRADLTGGMARMVDIHESIHTPDEYETRVLTDWILEKPMMKYKK
jgi:hypothetical protein